MKTYYEDLSPQQALDWLLKNDSGAGEGFWAAAQAKGEDLRADVFYNIRDFGADSDVSIFKFVGLHDSIASLESGGKKLGVITMTGDTATILGMELNFENRDDLEEKLTELFANFLKKP